MQSSKPNLVLRNDTILGVCEALGEDFRFNPLFLRVAFASLLLLNPAAVVGTYLGLGVLVALSRFAAPNPRPAAEPEAAPARDVEWVEPEPLAAAA